MSFHAETAIPDSQWYPLNLWSSDYRLQSVFISELLCKITFRNADEIIFLKYKTACKERIQQTWKRKSLSSLVLQSLKRTLPCESLEWSLLEITFSVPLYLNIYLHTGSGGCWGRRTRPRSGWSTHSGPITGPR